MKIDPAPGSTQRRVLGIGSAVAVMAALVLLLGGLLSREPEGISYPPAITQADLPTTVVDAEAGVFRTDVRELGVNPLTGARAGAGTRTLAGFRALRAYPGAPPRIPHPLGATEFMGTSCNQCHERGGFAQRFDAYAPVTPHPEMSNCLQCHAVQNTTGLFRPTDWQAADWPELGTRAMDGSPLVIPHTLQMRSNCLTCHGGPGAVPELRTTHPERLNCRQCHVPSLIEVDEPVAFSRPVDRAQAGSGGRR